jgi:hypothetical protein
VRDSAWELVERRMQGPFSDLGNPDRQEWVWLGGFVGLEGVG